LLLAACFELGDGSNLVGDSCVGVGGPVGGGSSSRRQLFNFKQHVTLHDVDVKDPSRKIVTKIYSLKKNHVECCGIT
jgi:hypothetical protein